MMDIITKLTGQGELDEICRLIGRLPPGPCRPLLPREQPLVSLEGLRQNVDRYVSHESVRSSPKHLPRVLTECNSNSKMNLATVDCAEMSTTKRAQLSAPRRGVFLDRSMTCRV